MTVDETFDNLSEEVASDIFLELAAFADISEQVTSTTHFHHEHDMLRCFKLLIEFDNIAVTSPSQDIELLHDFAF